MSSLQFGLRNHWLSTNVRADVLLLRMEEFGNFLKCLYYRHFQTLPSSAGKWFGLKRICEDHLVPMVTQSLIQPALEDSQ